MVVAQPGLDGPDRDIPELREIPESPELKAMGVAAIFTPGTPLPEITGWSAAALDEREAVAAG